MVTAPEIKVLYALSRYEKRQRGFFCRIHEEIMAKPLVIIKIMGLICVMVFILSYISYQTVQTDTDTSKVQQFLETKSSNADISMVQSKVQKLLQAGQARISGNDIYIKNYDDYKDLIPRKR